MLLEKPHHRHHFQPFEINYRVRTSGKAHQEQRILVSLDGLVSDPMTCAGLAKIFNSSANVFTETSWSSVTCAQLFFFAATDASTAAKLISGLRRFRTGHLGDLTDAVSSHTHPRVCQPFVLPSGLIAVVHIMLRAFTFLHQQLLLHATMCCKVSITAFVGFVHTQARVLHKLSAMTSDKNGNLCFSAAFVQSTNRTEAVWHDSFSFRFFVFLWYR